MSYPHGPNTNVALFMQIREQILQEPTSFDMEIFGKPTTSTPCGTTACIAGWANVLTRQDKRTPLSDTDHATAVLGLRCGDPDDFTPQERHVARVLGSPVFYVGNWPPYYYDCYSGPGKSKAGRAQAAAEFIEYVCGYRDVEGRVLKPLPGETAKVSPEVSVAVADEIKVPVCVEVS